MSKYNIVKLINMNHFMIALLLIFIPSNILAEDIFLVFLSSEKSENPRPFLGLSDDPIPVFGEPLSTFVFEFLLAVQHSDALKIIFNKSVEECRDYNVLYKALSSSQHQFRVEDDKTARTMADVIFSVLDCLTPIRWSKILSVGIEQILKDSGISTAKQGNKMAKKLASSLEEAVSLITPNSKPGAYFKSKIDGVYNFFEFYGLSKTEAASLEKKLLTEYYALNAKCNAGIQYKT